MPAQPLLYPYETAIAPTDATTRIFPHQSLLSGETPQATGIQRPTYGNRTDRHVRNQLVWQA